VRPPGDLYDRQKRYYDLRAGEYDETSWELLSATQGPEVARVVGVLASLSPARTLDVACGTGFLSQHLPGEITLLDASQDMLAQASTRVPAAAVVHADALPLLFEDQAFERVFSSHFYDHLRPAERSRFLAESSRVAGELVLVQEVRDTEHFEGLQRRALRDGSSHEVYKVLFTPESLFAELGQAELLYRGPLFAVVRRPGLGVTPGS
jgi:ubiquinone/menaquinone biosynthesis C-methylase UbiE